MRNQISILSWIFLVFSARASYAQDGPTLARATLAARVAEIERANDLSGYRDAQSWSEDQSRLREQLIEMLGLPPLENRSPDLQSAITSTLEFEDIVVEKLYFQSLPGLYVTAISDQLRRLPNGISTSPTTNGWYQQPHREHHGKPSAVLEFPKLFF